MSAQAYVAGLFPPMGNSIWKDDVKWQPIPVHVVDRSVLFHFIADFCPVYQRELKKVADKCVLKIYQENEEVMNHINRNIGMNITNLMEIMYLYDILHLENIRYPIPEWTKRIFPEPLKTLFFMFYDSLGFSTQMRRLGKILDKSIIPNLKCHVQCFMLDMLFDIHH